MIFAIIVLPKAVSFIIMVNIFFHIENANVKKIDVKKLLSCEPLESP